MKVPLRYIHEYRDRTGKVRRYFRRPGMKRIPLPGDPGSPGFIAAYNAALAGYKIDRTPVGADSRSAPGSVAAAIAEYYQHNSFLVLAATTRANRRAILERFRDKHGDKRLAKMRPEDVAKILGKMKPFAARNWLKALRGLIAFAVATGLRKDDATEHFKPVKAKAGTIHAWTDDDLALFESHHPPGSRARLAMALMFYTAARLGDAITFGPQHIRNGKLRYRQRKTGRQLALPVYPELSAILAEHPTKHLTFLTTAQGKPFTPAGFGNWFRDVCREAGLPHCSAHGLRKARLRILAELGASANELGAFGGHRTLSEVQRYTLEADQERLAEAAIRGASRTELANAKSRMANKRPTG